MSGRFLLQRGRIWRAIAMAALQPTRAIGRGRLAAESQTEAISALALLAQRPRCAQAVDFGGRDAEHVGQHRVAVAAEGRGREVDAPEGGLPRQAGEYALGMRLPKAA